MANIDREIIFTVEDYSVASTGVVMPAGQIRHFNNVTGFVSTTVLTFVGDGSASVATHAARALAEKYLPPVGTTYVQYPFDDTPATFYGGGTWVNISQKAKAYELSTSGWVSREAVGQTLYTETDYAVSDTISGSPSGTYDGETVNTVFTFTGQTFRFEGGNAETWEDGTQLDAMQRITGTTGGQRLNAPFSPGGTFTPNGVTALLTGAGGTLEALDFDSATSTSPNAAKTDDNETRMTNFTVRAWKRTA